MPKLIGLTLLGNEEKRAPPFLAHATSFVDEIVVLGDAPKDKTPEICRSYQNLRYHDSGYEASIFAQGFGMSRLYEDLWELLRRYAKAGDWILALDVDQRLNDRFLQALRRRQELLSYDWIGSRLLDLWEPGYYRCDGYWSPLVARLFRFKDVAYGRKMTRHASNLPAYLDSEKNGVTYEDFHIYHDGWILSPEERLKKQAFYLSLDVPGSINYQHAASITKPPILRLV